MAPGPGRVPQYLLLGFGVTVTEFFITPMRYNLIFPFDTFIQ
jgi:hypothetical protein